MLRFHALCSTVLKFDEDRVLNGGTYGAFAVLKLCYSFENILPQRAGRTSRWRGETRTRPALASASFTPKRSIYPPLFRDTPADYEHNFFRRCICVIMGGPTYNETVLTLTRHATDRTMLPETFLRGVENVTTPTDSCSCCAFIGASMNNRP